MKSNVVVTCIGYSQPLLIMLLRTVVRRAPPEERNLSPNTLKRNGSYSSHTQKQYPSKDYPTDEDLCTDHLQPFTEVRITILVST
eukprot:scaffold13723_cov338-Alexandrium_tamarense.AAC.1